ncbi:hypothetical protein RF11_15085 [Thelohanellus kitauei]|uniref:Uncharacterized protein n=1 Tax=Thelohanellus kitauei TaxID=669202 RepID=A0A0C2M7A9_THEKT|nr:hypothetical protein RF11_15085 [Thelohanellus kitauei]
MDKIRHTLCHASNTCKWTSNIFLNKTVLCYVSQQTLTPFRLPYEAKHSNSAVMGQRISYIQYIWYFLAFVLSVSLLILGIKVLVESLRFIRPERFDDYLFMGTRGYETLNGAVYRLKEMTLLS